MISALKHHLQEVATGDGLKARLIRAGLSGGVIQALSRILSLALSVVLARMLGAEGYGIYAYALAIMTLLMVVAEAGVPILMLREVAASHGRQEWGLLQGAIRRGVQLVLIASCGAMAIGLLVIWVEADRLSTPVFATTVLMLLGLPLLAVANVIAHALRGLEHIVLCQGVDLLVRPLLILIIVCGAFVVWPAIRQAQYAMLAQVVVSLIVLFVMVQLLRRLMPDNAMMVAPVYRSREWLASALPFTLLGGAGIINNQADIIMLGWFVSDGEVGSYRVATQGATLVAFGLQVANSVVAPQFSRLYAQGDFARLQHLVTHSARVVLLVALPVALIFILAGRPLIAGAFGPEYVAATYPLVILSIGQLVNAGFGSVGFLLNMTGNEQVTARLLWQTACMNIILNLGLIPLYGINGAAIATAISLIAWNVLLYQQVRQRLGINSTAFGKLAT